MYIGYAGLMLARTYAISTHKKPVLAALGVLGCCAIIALLVCSHSHSAFSVRIRDGHPSQPVAVLDECILISSKARTLRM